MNDKKAQAQNIQTSSLVDVRKIIQQQQLKAEKKSENAPSATALHRIEFMRKIEEGRINLDGSQQQACVFQQLDLDKDLFKSFEDMNFNAGDLDGATMGTRNANTRRIVIPLATSDRRKSEAAAKKNIRNEYASRYCELINVTPSAKNLARIQRMIPLESCTVSHMYNAGQARNNVVIEPSKVSLKMKEKDTTDDIVYKLLSAETGEKIGTERSAPVRKVTENAAFMRASKNRNHNSTQEISKFPSFDDYKYRFVFPWNVDDKESRTSASRSTATPETEATQRTRNLDVLDRLLAMGNNANVSQEKVISTEESRAVFSESEAINSTIQKELTSSIFPSEEPEIQSLLRQFSSGFPWAKLNDRLPSEVTAHFQRFIRSSEMVDVCLTICRLMYSAYIRPYCSSVPSLTQHQQEDLFLRIATALSTVVRTPDGIEHAIRLLAIRVVVLAELNAHLPTFSTCDIGEGVKKNIDTIITGLGDPARLVCRICVFESSPQALKMLRHKRLPRMNVQNLNSPLAKLLLNVNDYSDFPDEMHELSRFISLRNRQKLLDLLCAGF